MCVVSRFGVYYTAKRTEYQQSGGSESRAKDGAREKKTIQGGKGGQRVWFGETAGNVNIMRANGRSLSYIFYYLYALAAIYQINSVEPNIFGFIARRQGTGEVSCLDVVYLTINSHPSVKPVSGPSLRLFI